MIGGSTRLRAGASAATVAAAIALMPGCGGGKDAGQAGDLRWDEPPRLLAASPPDRDRVLSGTVRNTSLKLVRLDTKKVELLDAEGRPLRASVVFLSGFAHGRFPQNRPEQQPGQRDLELAGRLARLKPGKKLPLTVSWRPLPGAPRAASVRLGDATLPVPARAQTP